MSLNHIYRVSDRMGIGHNPQSMANFARYGQAQASPEYVRATCKYSLSYADSYAVYIYSSISCAQRRESGSNHGQIAAAVDSQTERGQSAAVLSCLCGIRRLTQTHSNSSMGNNVVTIFPTSRPPSVHQPHSPFSCRLLYTCPLEDVTGGGCVFGLPVNPANPSSCIRAHFSGSLVTSAGWKIGSYRRCRQYHCWAECHRRGVGRTLLHTTTCSTSFGTL